MVREEFQTHDLTILAFPFSEENRTEDLTLELPPSTSTDYGRLRTPILSYSIESKPQKTLLDHSVFTIGRGKQNQLSLPLITLSRVHGKFTKEEKGAWYLEDCGSCNGTFLNGRRIPTGQRRRLGMSAKIQFGDFCLDFHYPLQKVIRDFSPWVTLQSIGYFLLSSFWHWILIVGIFLFAWEEMKTLPGSKALKVSLLLEENTLETALPQQEKLFGDIQPIEEKQEPLPEEPSLESEDNPSQDFDEPPMPSDPTPFSELAESQNPLNKPISDSFSTRLFAKRSVPQKKVIVGEEGTSKEKNTEEQEGPPEVLEPDPISPKQDPLLSKVQQIKSSIFILNVAGAYDNSNFVLTQLGLKHKTVNHEILGLLLATPDTPFPKHKKLGLPPYLVPERDILVFNCGSFSAAVTEKHIHKLNEFVARGGYILTTDWALDWLVEAFPQKLASSAKTVRQGNYSVKLNKNAIKHPLFHGMPKSKWRSQWFVEAQSSRPYLRSKDVLSLAESNKGLPIAITFTHYKPVSGTTHRRYPGRVLHYVSHLHKQESFGATGDYPFQIILLNFILLKQKEYDAFLKF